MTGEPSAFDDEQVQKLVDELLLPVARRVAGRRQDRVDLQPESLAASVIKDHFDELIAACGGSERAANNLKGAIRYKLLDRLKKGGRRGQAVAFSQFAEDQGLDPSHNGPGAHTQFVEASGMEALRSALMDAVADDTDRRLIDAYVLGDATWSEVAEDLSISESAARKRLSRLRKTLVLAVLEPLRLRFSAPEWGAIEAFLVHRQPLDIVSLAVGLSAQEIESLVSTRVVAELTERYGHGLAGPFARVLGRLRS